MTAGQVPEEGRPRSVPNPDPTERTREDLFRAIRAEREITDGQFDVLRERLGGIDRATEVLNATIHRVPTELQQAIDHLTKLLTDKMTGHFIVDDERFRSVAQQFSERDSRAIRESADNKTAVDAAFLAAKGEILQLRALNDEKFVALTKQFDERFSSIAQQFTERDTRSERESRDNKVAVDAAFAAQKEAASEQNKSNTLAIDKSERATAETLNKQADLFKSTTDAQAANLADIKTRVERLESIKVGGQQAYAGLYALAAFIVAALAVAVAIAVHK